MLRWFVLFVCLKAMVISGDPELRCVHQKCKELRSGLYRVEDKTIAVTLRENKLSVHCGSWVKPDSPVMPRFSSQVAVRSVKFISCPPPTGTIAEALAAMNVTVPEKGDQLTLNLNGLQRNPSLKANHFTGLEHLTKLTVRGAEFMSYDDVDYYDGNYGFGFYPSRRFRLAFRSCFRNSMRYVRVSKPTPVNDFLAPLRHLRSLSLEYIDVSNGELQLPPTLHTMSLSETGVKRLLRNVLPNLKELSLKENALEEFTVLKRTMETNEGFGKVDLIPTVQTLTLTGWAQEQSATLDKCDALRTLHLVSPKLKTLPEYWVATCPNLVSLRVEGAKELTVLPSMLLEGGKAIVHLAFVSGVLETLPDGLLLPVPNLRSLDLSHNRLRILPSSIFKGPRALDSLNLSYNNLNADVQDVLADLVYLTSLNLEINKDLGDLCEPSGTSRLVNLKNLKTLSLLHTKVTRICSDWRLNLTKLEDLNLRFTNIAKLTFTDFQFTRDHNNCTVDMLLTLVRTIRFTKEEYEAALEAPETGAEVQPNPQLGCSCDMYWTWMALKRASHAVKTTVRCHDSRLLQDLTVQELCPKGRVNDE